MILNDMIWYDMIREWIEYDENKCKIKSSEPVTDSPQARFDTIPGKWYIGSTVPDVSWYLYNQAQQD